MGGVAFAWRSRSAAGPGEEAYDPSVDLWSVGCIFAEWLQKEPLFPGKTETELLSRIFSTLGTPTEEPIARHARSWEPGMSKGTRKQTCEQ